MELSLSVDSFVLISSASIRVLYLTKTVFEKCRYFYSFLFIHPAKSMDLHDEILPATSFVQLNRVSSMGGGIVFDFFAEDSEIIRS